MGIRMESNKDKILNTSFFIPLVLILLFSQISFAQVSFETYIENYYDDNIYNNSYKVEDFINSFF